MKTPASIHSLAIAIGLFLGLAIPPLAWGQSDEEMMEKSGDQDESSSSSKTPKLSVALTKTSPSPMVLWQMSQPDLSQLGEELARLAEPTTVAPVPIVTGPVLRNEAHVAFRYGNLPLARELFFGHLAMGGEAATPDLESVRFSALFRRPAWQIRWGLAVGIAGDSGVTNFDPIATGMSKAMGMETDMDDGSEMEEEMEEEDMEEEKEMMEDSDIDEEMMDEDDGSDGSDFRERKTAKVNAPTPEMLDPAVGGRLRELTGLVSEKLTAGMSSRMKSGQFGSALTKVAKKDPTQGYTVDGDTVSRSETPMWIPGVAYLGEGSSREMTETAKKEGIELLLYVVVSLKQSRNGEVQNICRAKVVDCKTGKTLVASGGMDNREAKRMMSSKRGTADRLVDDQLESLWKIIDARSVVSPMPTLTPEISRKRITQLMGDASYSKLRKLAEVRLLNHKGWITDQELEQAFEIVAGTDGVKILYAPLSSSIPLVHELARNSLFKEVE